jgi:hypothetical protein
MPSLAVIQEDTPLSSPLEIDSRNSERTSLRIQYLTSCAAHKPSKGGPGASFNGNIHHLDVKNDVTSLETKFACYKTLIGN